LIAKYARDHHNPTTNGNGSSRHGKKLRVLDLGCGKGGDLQKWQKAGLKEYIGVDIADVSIQQARSRWEQLRGPRFEASFYALDAFSVGIAQRDLRLAADLSSCRIPSPR
jgi:mRNA (guanine-N7-)-methyltransferase